MAEEQKKIFEEKVVSIAEAVLSGKPKNKNWKRLAIIAGIIIAIAALFAGGLYAYGRAYENRVYPGVYLGAYSLNGMTGDEVQNFVTELSSRLNKEGVSYVFNATDGTKKIKINSSITAGDAILDIVSADTSIAAKTALIFGRTEGWQKYFDVIVARFHRESLTVPVTIDANNFTETLRAQLSQYEKTPIDAGIKIISVNPLKYEITPEQTGALFDYGQIIAETAKRLGELNLEPITLTLQAAAPKIKSSELINFDSRLKKILDYGAIELTYLDPASKEMKTGKISVDDLAAWMTPVAENSSLVGFDLDKKKLLTRLENYKYILDRPAAESKFNLENGKLVEFRSGTSGQKFNEERTVEAIGAVMRARWNETPGATSSVALIVDAEEPKLKMADVNNLGITSIIGIGTSTFKDSHSNRIKNIAHAVERLNGTIIAPGEEFSAIRYAGPFTEENGYLPEEVIKGTEIKKEVGGGMCQIGTTLFRMAMNSGMPITQRTNHSLVVSYYADPVNHNPGTDAAIYEPILDLKFMNDTGNYMLVETNIDYKKQMLTFTLWGKPDGRYGYYSHPIVSKWITPGDEQDTYTTELAPGVQKCQNAFKGAVASFTYTRFTSTTEKIDRIFTSAYRALPKICMIGIASSTPSDGSSASSTAVVEENASSTTSI